jgi:urease beta subunit
VTGDRPVQIGSHFHFFEVNRALVFAREAGYGMRMDLPAGTAVRMGPGEIKTVRFLALSGRRHDYGCGGLVMGPLDDPAVRQPGFWNAAQKYTGYFKLTLTFPFSSSAPTVIGANPTE